MMTMHHSQLQQRMSARITAIGTYVPEKSASYFHTDGEGGIHVYRTGLSQHMSGQSLHGEGRIVQNGSEVSLGGHRSA